MMTALAYLCVSFRFPSVCIHFFITSFWKMHWAIFVWVNISSMSGAVITNCGAFYRRIRPNTVLTTFHSLLLSNLHGTCTELARDLHKLTRCLFIRFPSPHLRTARKAEMQFVYIVITISCAMAERTFDITIIGIIYPLALLPF